MTGPSKNPQPRARLLAIPTDLQERYRAYLAERSQPDDSGRIVWTAGINPQGYGRAHVEIRRREITTTAHRIAWLLERGPITDPNLVLDHLCRNRACLNVDHLELVTAEENSRRGNSWQRKERDPVQTDRESCVNGHPWPQYAAERFVGGKRRLYCFECSRASERRWYAKQRAAREG